MNPEPTNSGNGSNGGGEPPRPPFHTNHPGHAQDTQQSNSEETEQAPRGVSYMDARDDEFYRNRGLYTPAEQSEEFRTYMDFHNFRSAGRREQSLDAFVARHPDGVRLQRSYF